MTDSPKDIISRFVNEKLSDISGLKDFCFADLRGTYYGRCSGSSSFDCDNTRLANAIYVLLWGGDGNIFPGLTMENVGSGKDFPFRGDTMNSFRSVLGSKVLPRKTDKEPEVTPNIVNWVEENAAYPDDKNVLPGIISWWRHYGMGKKVQDFYLLYHTIGNFVVLPNRPLQSEKGSFILNTYRGSTWNDFFDRFLIELDKVLPAYDSTMGAESNVLPAHDGKKDTELDVFVSRSAFCGKTLRGLTDALFLRDYMNGDNTAPIPLFEPYSTTEKFRKNIDNEEYRVFAMRYIDTATKIISHRADIMCNRLSELLEA